ncbi:hypothetical protein BDQ17DRAFT_1362243 [Cyathus striatus]|nr:hypothetical protein BDQ17DRAFT_1362243 [Cyathus striatus]
MSLFQTSSSSYTLLHTSNDKENLQLPQVEKSKPFAIHRPQVVAPQRWTFFARWAFFVICEAAYLVLGALCLYHPIPLDLPTSWAVPAKAIFTVGSIIWQTFCALLISSIVTYLFSAEWYFQHRRTGFIVPRVTDKVSTLTSDLYDQTQHFFSSNSSRRFRISFILSLVILTLKGVAPAAIGISTVSLPVEMNVRVANLSAGSDLFQINDYIGYSRPLLIRRAAITAHMEQLENSTFKYKSQPNRIIPIPTLSDSMTGNITGKPLTYKSDYGKFDFTCEWTIPVGSDGLFSVSRKQWIVYNKLFVDPTFIGNYSAGIFPLTPVTYTGLTEEQSATETTTSVYLFAGRNSTFPNSTDLAGINLDNTPTVETNQILSPDARISAPLISLLACDPHLELSGGEITLRTDDFLEVSWSNDPLYGNMQQNLTNLTFTLGMIDVVSFSQVNLNDIILEDQTADWFMNDMSAKIFTANPSFNASKTPYIPPLPLLQINDNINKYFLSASKAFTDGYRFHPDLQGQSIVPIAFYSLASVPGIAEIPTVAIVTYKIVYYLACAQIGFIAILTPFLYRGWKLGKRYPFSFDTLWREKLLKEV